MLAKHRVCSECPARLLPSSLTDTTRIRKPHVPPLSTKPTICPKQNHTPQSTNNCINTCYTSQLCSLLTNCIVLQPSPRLAGERSTENRRKQRPTDRVCCGSCRAANGLVAFHGFDVPREGDDVAPVALRPKDLHHLVSPIRVEGVDSFPPTKWHYKHILFWLKPFKLYSYYEILRTIIIPAKNEKTGTIEDHRSKLLHTLLHGPLLLRPPAHEQSAPARMTPAPPWIDGGRGATGSVDREGLRKGREGS